MATEYDPVRPRPPLSGQETDLDRVRGLFETASSRYLYSPIPWFSWAVILPGAALLTPAVQEASGPLAVLLLWSVAILVGGAVEGLVLRGARSQDRQSDLARWVLRGQGNLSLVAVILTVGLALRGVYEFLPGVWLLLIGHSFFAVGGLASTALRRSGLLYQLGGLISLVPAWDSLAAFAVTTAFANLTLGLSLLRRS